MRIPKEIKTRNKIRDYRICRMYLDENMVPEEIGRHIGLSERQVSRILYKNRSVLEVDRNWEEIKQVQRIKRQIIKKGDSKKDVLDLEKQLHDILVGGKLKIEHSGEVKGTEHKINIIIPKERVEDAKQRFSSQNLSV